VVHPAVGEAAARIGAAVGLGILAPPLALLPLIDLGNAPDADCRALYENAQLASDTKAQAPRTRGNPRRAEPKSTSQQNVAGSR
jgi:hypothetical protein